MEIVWYMFKSKSLWSVLPQIPKNFDNLQAWYKRQYMICQCIIAASFASGRKQTSHGVVREIRFSVVRNTLTLYAGYYLLTLISLLARARGSWNGEHVWPWLFDGWYWVKSGCMNFIKCCTGQCCAGHLCKTLFERLSITFGQILLF